MNISKPVHKKPTKYKDYLKQAQNNPEGINYTAATDAVIPSHKQGKVFNARRYKII